MIIPEALIRAREAKQFSQPELARLAGCSQQLIGALELGNTKSTKFLPRIAAALGVDPGAIDSDWSGIAAPQEAPPDFERNVLGAKDFPIYAAVEGGPGEIIRSVTAVDWQPRPSRVEHVKEAYGLIVIGESMSPEFEQGEIAIVNPKLPPVGRQPCIFYTELHGEARATIKRFLRQTGTEWVVYQHNPPRGGSHEFRLPKKEWAICHRVVGKYYPQ